MSRDTKGKIPSRNGFLVRLRRDERGNTLAIMAAALIPMIGMVGSAVDISRAYLVKTRLQQACDAGVLAARRSMTGNSIANDTNAQTQATNFFNTNLKNGAYGATVTSISLSDVKDGSGNATGTIDGSASATVPTTLMKIFGKSNLTMTATCEAELQVANQDVVFVLDVTGSMNCPAATPSCSNNGGVEASNSKISAVRTGVVNFYDTLNNAMTAGSQLRIGIVPYSSDVNVGKLLPAGDLVDSWQYQSRVANMTTPYYVPNYGSVIGTGIDIDGSSVTQTGQFGCQGYGQTSPAIVSGGPPPAATQVKVYTNDYTAGVDWGWSGAPDTSGTSRSCRRHWTEYQTTYTTMYSFTSYTYQQTTYNTSQFKLGNNVALASGTITNVGVPTSGSYNAQDLAALSGATGVTTTNSSWDGCIEERDTVSQATFSTIPSTAYDLQIDLLPSSVATSWRPHWPDLIFDRSSPSSYTTTSTSTPWQPTADYSACPKAAQQLTVMSHQDVYNYVNASDFKAIGGTYHDVGMLWGGRLISPTGLFASQNATAPNGEPINRNIVFMTDGDMEPNTQIYGMYAYEKLDRRVSGSSNTPTNSDLQSRHNSRFSAICTALKNMNITIWVVAYDQTMTTQLQNCATPGDAFYASNDSQMQAALQTIASQIAELRLSK